MPGAARVGVDAAGGTINGPGVPSVKVNGAPISVVGDAVAGHGKPPHAGPTMSGSSGTVKAGNKPVCRAGDAATCGHAASGSSNVIIG
jgi:uncharacterized Zn-binding protein involved in type VI secretion